MEPHDVLRIIHERRWQLQMRYQSVYFCVFFALGLLVVHFVQGAGWHRGGELLHDSAHDNQRLVRQRDEDESVDDVLFRHSSREVSEFEVTSMIKLFVPTFT